MVKVQNPLEIEAHSRATASMYRPRPVPFRTHSNDDQVEFHSFKSLQRLKD